MRTRKRSDGSTYLEPYCSPCTRNSTDRYRQASPEARLLSSCRARAKLLGLPFELMGLALPPAYPVFGIPLVYQVGRRTDNTASVDRIVPALGYVPGNVLVISWKANRLKSNATLEELQRLADFYTAGAGQPRSH